MGDEIYISEIIEWINDNLCRYKIEGKDSIQFQDWKNEEITFFTLLDLLTSYLFE